MTGKAAAHVMARANRAAEEEAIEVLDPSPGQAVLAIGIGPGVGVQRLAERLGHGYVGGVDPSLVMIEHARRRNRRWVDAGAVEIVRARADRLPWPDARFDGAIAVNSVQLWDPLEASLAEVSRVLRPAARLVTLTHDWAIRRKTGKAPPEWCTWMGALCAAQGLVAARLWEARAEGGRSVGFEVTRD